MAAVAATGIPTRAHDLKNGFNNANTGSLISTTTTSSSYPFVHTNRSTNASSSFNLAAVATSNKPTPFNHSNLVSSNESLSNSKNMIQKSSNLPVRKPPQPPNPSEASMSHPQLQNISGNYNSKRKPVLAESLIKKIQKITSNNTQKPINTTTISTTTPTNTSNNLNHPNANSLNRQNQQVPHASRNTDNSRALMPTSTNKPTQMNSNPPNEQHHQHFSSIQSHQHIQQPPAFATTRTNIYRRPNQVPISNDAVPAPIAKPSNTKTNQQQLYHSSSTFGKQKPSTFLTELNESSELSNPLTNSSLKNKSSSLKGHNQPGNGNKRYSSEKNVQRMSTYIISSAHQTHNNNNNNNAINNNANLPATNVNQAPKKTEKRLRFNLDESLRSNLSINDEQVKRSLENKSYNSYKKKKDFISANKQIDAYLAKNENRVKKILERVNKNHNEIKPLPGTKQTFNLKRSNENLESNKLNSVEEEDFQQQSRHKFQQPRMRFNKFEHNNSHLKPMPSEAIIKTTAAITNNVPTNSQAYQASTLNSNSTLELSSLKSINDSEMGDRLTNLKPIPPPPMTNTTSTSLLNHSHHNYLGQTVPSSLQQPHPFSKLSSNHPISLRHHMNQKESSINPYSKKYLDYESEKLGPSNQANMLSRRYDTILNYAGNQNNVTAAPAMGGNKSYRNHFINNPTSIYPNYGPNVPNRIDWITPAAPAQSDFNFYKPYRPMSPMRHLARLT